MQTGLQVSSSVSVIICTRDRPDRLEECLRALRDQSYPRFDVLVVDNGTSTPVANICERFGASCVRAPIPGLTRARNIGARVARGEIVAYIDDDAIVEPGWLHALVAGFRDPTVAAVSGRVRYMKAVGESRAISDEVAQDDSPRPPGRFDLTTSGWFTKASFGGVGDGGNMAFRRAAIVPGPGFDERLGRGQSIDSGDEHVLFATLIASGHVVLHEPDAVVRHPSPATPELRIARRWADLRSSIAYLAFLWSQCPRHRREIRAFIGRALARRMTLDWALSSRDAWVAGSMAIVAGILTFTRARREWVRPRQGVRAAKAAKAIQAMVGSTLDSR